MQKMRKSARLIRRTIPLLMLLLVLLNIAIPPYSRGQRAVLLALEQLEKPYVFASAGPKSFDCSGLVKYCYAAQGIALDHSAQQVGYSGRYLKLASAWMLEPGDLVFFDTVDDRDLCDHVGLWLGGNQFVHASTAKGKVIVSDFDEKWRARFSWARRVACPLF